MAKVAVANLYHMLAYAWQHLDLDWWNAADSADLPDPQNLLARLLVSGAGWIVHRGLDRGYVERTEELAGIRGRVDLDVSLQRMLLQRGRAECRFDELETDLLQNRLLKTTMLQLTNVHGLDGGLRIALHRLAHAMSGVSLVRIHAGLFREVRIHGGNKHYGPVLQLCELIHGNLLAEPSSGKMTIRDFTQDERQMGHLFQAFVASYWKRHTSLRVITEVPLDWDLNGTGTQLPMPRMRMDVLLRSPEKTLVVECKFTRCMEVGRYGKATFRSAHLYQLHSYLTNLEAKGGPDARAEGLLLYPRTESDHDHAFELHGHPVRLATVDLSRDWRSIEQRLQELVMRMANQEGA